MKKYNNLILISDNTLPIGDDDVTILNEISGRVADIIHFRVDDIEKSGIKDYLNKIKDKLLCVDKMFFKTLMTNCERELIRAAIFNKIYLIDFFDNVVEPIKSIDMGIQIEEVDKIVENENVAVMGLINIETLINIKEGFLKSIELKNIRSIDMEYVSTMDIFEDNTYSSCLIFIQEAVEDFINREIIMDFDSDPYDNYAHLIDRSLYIIDTTISKLYKINVNPTLIK